MRKTNLFYTNGIDSKFLTFSNYTESLTGNFISTDTKIFPSKFICIDIIDNTTGESLLNKQELINLLVRYYENKLAVLRDDCVYHNVKCEDYITPLAYLFKTLDMYCDNYRSWKITYYGDITEQDFNGTYTDTICIIDSSNDFYKEHLKIPIEGNVRNDKNAQISKNTDTPVLPDSDNLNCLYNWNDRDLDAYYSKVYHNDHNPLFSTIPIFDEYESNESEMISGTYMYEERDYDKIEFTKNSKKITNNKEITTEICNSCGCEIQVENEIPQNPSDYLIKFNIVIPLFDITNMNYHANDVMIDNLDKHIETIELRNDAYRKNVPLGIWFADEPIILKKDIKTGFSQTWSLVISSQFKPFPYAKLQVNETNDISNSNSFPTFAMVLSKQNQILEKFNYLESIIISQQNQIDSLQAQVKNTLSASNIDNIKKNFLKYQYDMTQNFNKLKQTVSEYMDNLRWNGTE